MKLLILLLLISVNGFGQDSITNHNNILEYWKDGKAYMRVGNVFHPAKPKPKEMPFFVSFIAESGAAGKYSYGNDILYLTEPLSKFDNNEIKAQLVKMNPQVKGYTITIMSICKMDREQAKNFFKNKS